MRFSPSRWLPMMLMLPLLTFTWTAGEAAASSLKDEFGTKAESTVVSREIEGTVEGRVYSGRAQAEIRQVETTSWAMQMTAGSGRLLNADVSVPNDYSGSVTLNLEGPRTVTLSIDLKSGTVSLSSEQAHLTGDDILDLVQVKQLFEEKGQGKAILHSQTGPLFYVRAAMGLAAMAGPGYLPSFTRSFPALMAYDERTRTLRDPRSQTSPRMSQAQLDLARQNPLNLATGLPGAIDSPMPLADYLASVEPLALCEASSTKSALPCDTGGCNSNDMCESYLGEDCNTCSADCGTCQPTQPACNWNTWFPPNTRGNTSTNPDPDIACVSEGFYYRGAWDWRKWTFGKRRIVTRWIPVIPRAWSVSYAEATRYSNECTGLCGTGCNGGPAHMLWTYDCLRHDNCTQTFDKWGKAHLGFGRCTDELIQATDDYLWGELYGQTDFISVLCDGSVDETFTYDRISFSQWAPPCNSAAQCGNGKCDPNEGANTCQEDCAEADPANQVCNDGSCNGSEDDVNCPQDCPPSTCNDGSGTCDAGETSGNCPSDCGGGYCGNMICESLTDEVNTCPGDCSPSSLIPALTSNTSNGTASASGVYSSAYPAYLAFGGVYNGQNAWLSNMNTSAVWLSYVWSGSTSKRASAYRVSYSNGSCCEQRGPKNWLLQGYTGSSWVTIDTVTDQTGWYSRPVREFTIDSPGTYRGYRLYMTKDNYNGSYPITLVHVDQFQLLP